VRNPQFTSFGRRLANRAKDLLFNPLLDRPWLRAMRGVVTCVLYHRVEDPARHEFLRRGGSPVMTAEELARDLRFLKDVDARFLTFGDLRGGRFVETNEIGIIVSFDDCFRTNYTTGLDVLDRFGVKGVFFQTSAFVNARTLLWEQLLYWHVRDASSSARFVRQAVARFPESANREASRVAAWVRENVPPQQIDDLLAALGGDGEADRVASDIYPVGDDVRRAHSGGHEVGSHGHRHLKRSTIAAADFEADLAESCTVLDGILGHRPAAFSYPFNSYTPGDALLARRYFAQAATVDGMRIARETDPMWIPRFTWPGVQPNSLRWRRWMLTGRV
jgi:peptidoglycan/xylan/chitin deacetylase (PgdA/CDA1 family)